MKTTTYVCDRCQKSVGEKDLYPVRIDTTKPGSYSTQRVNKDMCKDCMVDLGILEIKHVEGKAPIESINEDGVKRTFIKLLKALDVCFTEEIEDLVSDAIDNR